MIPASSPQLDPFSPLYFHVFPKQRPPSLPPAPYTVDVSNKWNSVSGPPGSGKTVLILQRVREIQMSAMMKNNRPPEVCVVVPEGTDVLSYSLSAMNKIVGVSRIHAIPLDTIRCCPNVVGNVPRALDFNKLAMQSDGILFFDGIVCDLQSISTPTFGVYGDGKSIAGSDFTDLEQFLVNNPGIEAWLEINSLTSPSYGVGTINRLSIPQLQQNMDSDTPIGEVVCECGGDKTRTAHSTWCPKFVVPA